MSCFKLAISFSLLACVSALLSPFKEAAVRESGLAGHGGALSSVQAIASVNKTNDTLVGDNLQLASTFTTLGKSSNITEYYYCGRALHSAWAAMGRNPCEDNTWAAAERMRKLVPDCSKLRQGPAYVRSYSALLRDMDTWCGGPRCSEKCAVWQKCLRSPLFAFEPTCYPEKFAATPAPPPPARTVIVRKAVVEKEMPFVSPAPAKAAPVKETVKNTVEKECCKPCMKNDEELKVEIKDTVHFSSRCCGKTSCTKPPTNTSAKTSWTVKKSAQKVTKGSLHNITKVSAVALARGAFALAPSKETAKKNMNSSNALSKKRLSFRDWYDSHSEGRGIWKWNIALDAYQRHFASFMDTKVNVGEVGIQSGGSILMWQDVMGQGCHVFGIDINRATTKFANYRTTVTIGDQADPQMWHYFFANAVPQLDLLIDDGGHEAHQMVVTLQQVFPHLSPGGYIAIEDIHGQHYVNSFFFPAATSLSSWAQQGHVSSVHVYPYLLIARKADPRQPILRMQPETITTSFSGLDPLMQAITKHKGESIAVDDPAHQFLTEAKLKDIFARFGALHDSNIFSTPKGCDTTSASICGTLVLNSPLQATVTGVHIYADQVVVDVAPTTPVIAAVRRGTEWLPY